MFKFDKIAVKKIYKYFAIVFLLISIISVIINFKNDSIITLLFMLLKFNVVYHFAFLFLDKLTSGYVFPSMFDQKEYYKPNSVHRITAMGFVYMIIIFVPFALIIFTIELIRDGDYWTYMLILPPLIGIYIGALSLRLELKNNLIAN